MLPETSGAQETVERRVLAYAGAACIVTAALSAAAQTGVSICVAVVDWAGALIGFARMDGAPLLSIGLAQDKAYSVAAFNGQATHEWYPALADEPPLLYGIVKTDRLVIFGGGVPVRVGEQFVGAVGISGGTAEQDRKIAVIAASALDEAQHGGHH